MKTYLFIQGYPHYYSFLFYQIFNRFVEKYVQIKVATLYNYSEYWINIVFENLCQKTYLFIVILTVICYQRGSKLNFHEFEFFSTVKTGKQWNRKTTL